MFVLICSVGGSPEPVRKSIEEQQPEHVIYVASPASRKTIRQEIEAGLAWRGIVDTNTITLSDFQNLLACVRDIRRGIEHALHEMRLPEDVRLVADITGGTKVMSSALTLVMMEHNHSRFAYVGGESRTKNGLGVVESGRETFMRQDNPWEVMALREVRNLARAFNADYFAAALETARDLADHVSENRGFYGGVRDLVQAYAQWDAFDHKNALSMLRQAINRLKPFAVGKTRLCDQLANFEKSMGELDKVQQDAQELRSSRAALSSSAGGDYLKDLLSNARRRARAGRFDDAVARLYSAIEKNAKIALLARHGIDNSNIDLDRVPEAMREILAEARDGSGPVRVGLQKSFLLLDALDDPLGKKYRAHEAELKKSLEARNQSLLAHGYNPVPEDACARLFAIALDFLDVREEDLPVFPQIAWKSLIL